MAERVDPGEDEARLVAIKLCRPQPGEMPIMAKVQSPCGSQDSGIGFRVSGFRFRVSGFGLGHHARELHAKGMSFRRPLSLDNMNLVGYFPPGSQAF